MECAPILPIGRFGNLYYIFPATFQDYFYLGIGMVEKFVPAECFYIFIAFTFPNILLF